MKSGFLKSDWFLGLVVVVVMLALSGSDLLQGLERKAYDIGVTASTRTPSERIAVIAIDDASIANIGRWPWPRDVMAKMIDLLAAAQAKVIGNTVLFSEPQVDPGYRYIAKALELAQGGPGAAGNAQMVALLKEAEQALNTDRKLAESEKNAGNVVLPMVFTLGEPRGRPDKPPPDYVQRNAVGVADGEVPPLPTYAVLVPVAEIGRNAVALGHVNKVADVDGGIRAEPLALQYFDQFYPSLSMMIAAKSLNLGPADIKLHLGDSVSLGRLRISTDAGLQMYTFFYKDRDGQPAFQVDSFYDVLSGKIPASKYRDKIVLIGATAAGVGSASVTPVSPAMPPVVVLAHAVSSILQEHFFIVPGWGRLAEIALLALVAAYLIVLLPRLKASHAAALTAGLLVALLATQFGLLTLRATWLQLMLPATILLVGHLALISKRFIVTERAKLRSDESSAESSRLLGLALQGQGRLDEAWDKFRQVPLADAVLDNLYNLALDFERKRQFNKAEAVFRHMHGFNPKFRDLETRLSRAQKLSETVMLGGSGGHPGGTLALDAGEKPMLGRYQVEKELGKGAMGVVYLGRDPKIGRVVAIKTLALSQEFEADELAEVKERFFREAETAGRLSHPNIVTIYDAGEEHDLCYIAMELLKGEDLAPFTKADHLLRIDKVISIIGRVADALGYAHRQGVVHRDVKPANVMYDPQSDSVKVTDFGIARLTDSSKTKTGMVLGTPSFMSPEQLAGKKIDGRSDLFSLAGTLFQLLCGRLPFEGESMAQLMFKIANEMPPDPRTINPKVPPGLAVFIARAMAKDPDQRFQTGEAFAQALRASLAGGGSAARPAQSPQASQPQVTQPSRAQATAAADRTQPLERTQPVERTQPMTRTQPLDPGSTKPSGGSDGGLDIEL
jgi:serine/threonine protein kinase/CHASE2 domain-containing sensor protein